MGKQKKHCSASRRKSQNPRRVCGKRITFSPIEEDSEFQELIQIDISRKNSSCEENFVQICCSESVGDVIQYVINNSDHSYSLCPSEEISNDSLHMNGKSYIYTFISEISHEESFNVQVEPEEVIIETESFQKFILELKNSIKERDFCIRESEDNITLVKFYDKVTVCLTVNINSEFKCNISVHRKPIENTHSLWEGMPEVFITTSSVLLLLDRLDTYTVCCGNLEEQYQSLAPIGGGLSNGSNNEILAYREGDFGAVSSDGKEYSSTIRSTKCDLLTTKKVKCTNCVNYGYALKKRLKRLEERASSERKFIHSSFKHRDMTRTELYQKLDEQKNEIKDLNQTVWKLRRQLDRTSRVNGVNVNEHEHDMD